jgi:hypothetical protein
MRRLNLLPLNSSLNKVSGSCCSGPGLDGGCGIDGPGPDGGAGGGWSSVGPGPGRGPFKSMFKLPCGGGGLESCDGDEPGDFGNLVNRHLVPCGRRYTHVHRMIRVQQARQI